ncbi:MAG: DUF779 domain-containing protein [Gammaproteobacteria bacterium]|jgi:uncharacterized protein (DUF779 family)|nr:DUF779 domain-containing protein [Gammaproteobacteria bacterium]MBK8131457.1 DUF779 domain-containing protein [Gammaproteobacteria bacterium]MBK9428247.1 DUF779 domain-containing protein [Gammaproteobacteria bacterium]
MTEFCERLAITDAARAVVDQLRARHGALLFHQSGGCCDGSAPMCFAVGDFRIGSRDVCLGEVHGCKFYMSPEQFQYYENCHTTIDVVPGRGASFSLEIPLGVRFLIRSRLLTEAEQANLRPVGVGAED